jgi:IPT/TIG domain
MLKRMKKMFLLLIHSGLGLLVFTQCTNDYPGSIYNPDATFKPNPTISQMLPDFALAGVDQVTIIGNNFSPLPDKNLVYFNGKKISVISSNENNIIVKAPNTPLDSIKVQIDVTGAELFSNIELYNLAPAVEYVFPFESYQEPYTVTSDGMGNLYFSFIEDAVGKGIYKVAADGVLSEFAPKSGETTFSDLKYNSDGYLIGVWGKSAIFKIEAGVKTAVFVNTNNSSIKLFALDYDKEKNIWAAGKGGKIVCAKPDQSFKLFDYEYEISSLRVFNDHLYAISNDDEAQTIVRFSIISPDSLGSVETVFNFSSNAETGVIANSLTFSADGQIFIATTPFYSIEEPRIDPIDPIVYIDINGSLRTWYPGLIESTSSSLVWGSGTEMYIIKDKFIEDPMNPDSPIIFEQNIIKVNMRQAGAPDYGKD